MKAAAKDLHALGPLFVLVKGGHLEQGEPVLHHTAAISTAAQPHESGLRAGTVVLS